MSSLKTQVPVIIDTDPGIDDAFALVCGHSTWHAIHWATVAGNSSIENVTRNAHFIRSRLNTDINIGVGSESPLILPGVTAEHIHGLNGLAGLANNTTNDKCKLTTTARDLYLEIGKKSHEVRVAALGPLTNIAKLILAKELPASIEEIIWLGTTFSNGNITPVAEFNAYYDPHAFKTVLCSSVNLKVIPLDIVRQLPLKALRIPNPQTSISQLAVQLLLLMKNSQLKYIGDVCAVAALERRNYFKWESLGMNVCCNNSKNRGKVTPCISNYKAEVATSVHVPQVIEFINEILERISKTICHD